MVNTLELLIKVSDQASGALENVGTKIQEVNKEYNDLAKENEIISGKLKDAMQKWGVAIGAAGIAMEALSRQQAQLTEDTRIMAEKVGMSEQAFRDMVIAVTPATDSVSEWIEVMRVGSRQGLDTAADLAKFADIWTMVDNATGESAAELANAGKALQAVGIEANKQEQALAAFGYVFEECGIQVGDFLNFIGKAAPNLNALNMSVDDAATALGVLTDRGISGRQATSELNRAIEETVKAYGDAAQAVQDLTLENEDLISQNKELTEQNSDLSRNLKGLLLDREEQIEKIKKLVTEGRRANETEAEHNRELERAKLRLDDINDAIDDNQKKQAENTETQKENTKTISDNSSKIEDNQKILDGTITQKDLLIKNLKTTKEKWDEESQKVKDNADTIEDNAAVHDSLVTSMQKVENGLKELAYKYGDVADKLDFLSPLLMGVGGTLAAAPSIINTVLPRVQSLAQAFGTGGGLSGVLSGLIGSGGAGGLLGGLATVLTGPVGIALVGGAAAAVGLYAAYKTNFLGMQDVVNGFKEFVSDRFENVKTVFGNMVSSLSPHVDKLKDAFGNLFAKIDDLFTKMTGGISISEAFGKVFEVVGKVVDTIVNVAFKVLGGLISVLVDAVTGFIDVLSGLVDWFGKVAEHPIAQFFREILFGAIKLVIEKIEGFCDMINTLVSNSDAMVSNIKAGWEGIKKTVSDKVSEMGQAFETFRTNAATAFEGLRTTIADKITDAILTAKTKFDEFVSKVNEVTAAIGKAFTDVVNKVKEILAPITKTFQDIINTITSAFETARKKFEEVFQPVIVLFDAVKSAIQAVIQKIIDLVNSPAVQAILTVIGGPVKTLAGIFGNELNPKIDETKGKIGAMGNEGTTSAGLIQTAAGKISGFLSGLTGPADTAKKGIENIGSAGNSIPGNISPGVEGTKSKINEIAATAKNVESKVNQTFAQINTAAAQTAEYVAHSQSNASTSNYTGVVRDAQGNPVSVPAGISSLPAATTTTNPAAGTTTPSATNPVVTMGPIQGTNLNYTSAEWYAMDANARQQLANSGQVYTVAGTTYKNGNEYNPTSSSNPTSGSTTTGTGTGTSTTPVAISAPPEITAPTTGFNWLAYDGGKKYGMTRTPDGDDASLVEITTEQFKNQILERPTTPVYSNKSGTGDNLNAWPKSVIFPYSTSVVKDEASRKLFYLQTERIGGLTCQDKVAAFPYGSDWALTLQQKPYMNEGEEYRLWKTIAKSDISNLMWGSASERIPGLALGGSLTKSGLALVGERGPELIELPKGATVIPLDKTNQAIDYNLLADKVATAVTRAIGSGVVRDLHLHGNFFGDEAAFRQLNRKLKSVNNMESVRTGV